MTFFKPARVAVLAAMIGALVPGVAPASAADSSASCSGIVVSSVAVTTPGLVAELTRQFHDEFKAQGLAPGRYFDAPFAQMHAGSVDACLAGFGGG